MKGIVARPMHDVEFELTAPHEGAIVITDDKGKKTAYAINPDGLGAILSQGFSLAAGWAGHPDLQPETFCGRGRAQVANLVGIEKGRTDTEAALSVRVGALELSFLVPIDLVMTAIAKFVQQVDMSQAGPIKKH